MTNDELIQRSLAEAARWFALLSDVRSGEDSQRLEAAAAFRRSAAPIVALGDAAVPILTRTFDDTVAALAAKRILALIPSRASLDALLAEASSLNTVRAYVGSHTLRELEVTEPLVPALVEAFRRAPSAQARSALATLALRVPTPEGLALAEETLRSSAEVLIREGVVSGLISRADQRYVSLLRLAAGDRNPRVRIEALFGLALVGERERTAELVEACGHRSSATRGQAVYALGRLGLPEGARQIDRALGDRNAGVRSVALLSAAYLGAPGPLRTIAKLFDDQRPAVRAQAEAVFPLVTGQVLPYPATAAPEALRRAVEAMARERRYFHGRPWIPAALVATLPDPSASPFTHPNLVSATGHRFGFDPERDLVGNLEAIESWNDTAGQQACSFEPGGWYYQGQRTD